MGKAGPKHERRHYRHSTGEIEHSPIQVVKMGKSSRAVALGIINAPVPASPTVTLSQHEEALATDITEELRSTAPNIGRDVIALSTSATPVQLSMSPQEEMLTHVQVEQAMLAQTNVSSQRDLIKGLLANNSVRKLPIVAERKWYVLHPHGNIRLRWDVISIMLIFYNALYIPFQISFQSNVVETTSFTALEYAMDIFFGLDMISSFFTGIEVKAKVYFDLPTIAKHYTSTCLVDTNNLTISKSLKLFRLFRLLRLFRMLRILHRLQHALLIRSTISSLFRYCLTVVFIAHWFACYFFWVSYGDSTTSDPPIDTWLKIKGLLYGSQWDQYVASLYWATMTLATVGYGDVSAISPNERCFAVFAMFAGAGIFAYGITNIVSLVSSLTAHETAFREKMDEINEYMSARDLPKPLRTEIREFFQNARKSKENDMLQEQELLNELSAMLRSKIALAINDHFLWKFPFFKGSDPNFIMDLALSMRMICFAPFEDVCVEGELGHEMFFIFRGAVEVLKDGVQVTVLGENQYFGEMAILNRDCKRMATVRTLCFCELRMLSRVRFLEALVHFPKMMQKLATYSKARAHNLQNSESNDGSSDRKLRRKSSSVKPKAAGYRLNWKNPMLASTQSAEAVSSDAMIQLNQIKRSQDTLAAKIKEMHEIMESIFFLTDTMPYDEEAESKRLHRTCAGAKFLEPTMPFNRMGSEKKISPKHRQSEKESVFCKLPLPSRENSPPRQFPPTLAMPKPKQCFTPVFPQVQTRPQSPTSSPSKKLPPPPEKYKALHGGPIDPSNRVFVPVKGEPKVPHLPKGEKSKQTPSSFTAQSAKELDGAPNRVKSVQSLANEIRRMRSRTQNTDDGIEDGEEEDCKRQEKPPLPTSQSPPKRGFGASRPQFNLQLDMQPKRVLQLELPDSVPIKDEAKPSRKKKGKENFNMNFELDLELEEPSLEKSYDLSASGTFDAVTFQIKQTGIAHHLSPTQGGSSSPRNMKKQLIKLGVLGKGASGVVHKALHVPSLLLVAIKVIPVFENEKRHQLIAEVKTLYNNMSSLTDESERHKVACPEIVCLYDAYMNPNEGNVSIVVEYMDGGSLQDIVDTGGCSSESVLASISFRVLKGLRFLHEHHQLHRDIKPSNLLINQFGDVKVSDFGIAKEMENSIAKATTFVGTLTYMSPERIASEVFAIFVNIVLNLLLY
ncbi:Voltage-gated Ion Channel (VIC) Superfamily [Thraustotheca clavata]|uniref:Voltage-gated Ion Channel (VIC) Superfamily n=1 Tax=Thraustotheca clavata TaxID=74557 RepID=A0A1V9ZBR1_9STRA|nr:Voltage-gated Ion Channel (VIC) Superfamily [Thraustotheca clavata]